MSPIDLRPRYIRWIELVVLWVFIPVLNACIRPGRAVLPLLWVASGMVAVVMWRDSTWPREVFSVRRLADGRWPVRLVRWLGVVIILAWILRWIRPDWLWGLPRRDPLLWMAVMVFYPLASVLPQTLLYRCFFWHRYEPLFPSARHAELAGATLFAVAHIVFLNPVAPLLSFVGGWLFLRTYRESGSFWASAAEHALYGAAVMTIGWGAWFYHGSLRTLSAWLAL